MASFAFNTAAKEILDGTIDLNSDTIKVMLITGSSVYDPVYEDDVVDDGTGSAALHGELSVTGYTPGFGSANRQTLSNKNFTVDDANNDGVFDNTADLTWTSLGAGSVISGALVIKEVTDDTDTRVIAWLELDSGVTTNGSDVTIQFNANGLIRLSVD